MEGLLKLNHYLNYVFETVIWQVGDFLCGSLERSHYSVLHLQEVFTISIINIRDRRWRHNASSACFAEVHTLVVLGSVNLSLIKRHILNIHAISESCSTWWLRFHTAGSFLLNLIVVSFRWSGVYTFWLWATTIETLHAFEVAYASHILKTLYNVPISWFVW